MTDFDECPECRQPKLKWDSFSGHWDCLACGWTTEGPEPDETKEDEHHAG